jgi:hypothetical protein
MYKSYDSADYCNISILRLIVSYGDPVFVLVIINWGYLKRYKNGKYFFWLTCNGIYCVVIYL